MNLPTKYPVALGGAILGLVAAATPILLLLGVKQEVVEAIGGMVVPTIAFVTALQHAHVTPTSSVALTNDDVAALRTKPVVYTASSVTVGAGGGGGYLPPATGGVGGYGVYGGGGGGNAGGSAQIPIPNPNPTPSTTPEGA